MRNKRKLSCALLMSFLAIALANTIADTRVLSSSEAKLYVDPHFVYEEKDATLKVDLKIADVNNLYSWQVNMSFDPNVLEFSNVTEGEFLKEQPEGATKSIRDDHIQDGWVLFSWATMGKYLGVTGSGTLATVEFTVGEGQSPINITNPLTKLLDIYPPPVPPGGQMFTLIPHTGENGFFTNLVDPPEADFTFSPSLPALNVPVTFDASASSATAPHVINSYQWDFGDGTKKIYKGENLTSTANHTYTTSANYTVSLTVTDNATATELIQALYGITTMPQVWYERYSTKTRNINIKFGSDIAITNISPSSEEVTVGDAVYVNVTVLNKGTETESFNVIAYYGDNVIGTKQVTDLAPDEEEILIFDWDTTDVAALRYQIRAEAPLEGDGYTEDNSFIDGTVTVNSPGEPFPILVVAAVIVVIVVLAAVGFLYMRRRR